MTTATPMISQYKEIKSRHQDAILFFRLGDFYEMFYEDAELGARELGLTLTGRGQDENRMPMCGIPYHAAEGYIAKLVDKGFKVAICEQVEDPKLAKGLVKRDVIKIYSPGTLIETSMIADKTNNYLAVVSYDKKNNRRGSLVGSDNSQVSSFGLAFIDASTGEFRVTELVTAEKLFEEINRINPSEILFSDMWPADHPTHLSSRISHYKDKYDPAEATERLNIYFKTKSLASFGIEDLTVGLSAAASAIDYLQENQKTSLGHINKITPYLTGEYMFIDSQTRKNLELVQTIRDKASKGSLLWILDQCNTNMGSRLLRNWLLAPLMDKKQINLRLDAVEELLGDIVLRTELAGKLRDIFDIERLTAKVAASSANAKDLVSLCESLNKVPIIKNLLSNSKASILQSVKKLPELSDAIKLLESAIVDNPPFVISDGGIIKEGYDLELDELRKIARGGKSWIAELENSERQKTGIKSLKVGFNKVFGYYIEITSSNLDQIPQDYIRKQTLTNCERFITPDLKDKEALILNADERSREMEYQIFCKIRSKISEYILDLQKIAGGLAELDAINSLSIVAANNNYCRPLISRSSNILISCSRHPVAEKTLGQHNFVPNDISMDEESSFLLITGPNMAGKSTYMRQAALIAIMAQMGSFVPAKETSLPIIDRIFTRIGAMDDIYSGQSTFMLEMTETANILNNATENSLIILDEIGRGTATFDGMSIAAAVAEYIHTKIKAKTMFATHYHEITHLADKHSGMKNLSVLVKESGDNITFLHKIVEGSADKSYGIQVARLAGLPAFVITRAKEVYNNLEMVENDIGKIEVQKSSQKKTLKSETKETIQVSLF